MVNHPTCFGLLRGLGWVCCNKEFQEDRERLLLTLSAHVLLKRKAEPGKHGGTAKMPTHPVAG